VQEIFYYPFGELKYNSGSDIAKYKFTDQEFDGETTLYNYGARYYDPHLARFVSADTIVPQPFNPQSLNRYSYASNNPVLMIDPDGHDDYYCCGGGGGDWGGGGGGGGDDDWCRIYGCTGSEEPPSGGGGGGNGGGEPAPPPPPLTWSPNIVPVRMNPMTFTGVNMNSRFGFGTNMPATVTGGVNSGVNLVTSSYMGSNSRVSYAMNELRNNSGQWAWWNWKFELPHNKCNEFIYAAFGGSSSGFPTVLRNNGYYIPNISDLADPDFEKNQLLYGSINEVQSGDAVVWYSKALQVHHGGLYIGNNQVINATFWGLRVSTISYINRRYNYQVTPIIRRVQY
jgi:RHS repeat-associated protein